MEGGAIRLLLSRLAQRDIPGPGVLRHPGPGGLGDDNELDHEGAPSPHSGMVKIDMDAIRRLSVAERVQLVQDIWDTLQPTAEDLPLTDDQREVLERRLAEHQADPVSAVPWETVRARLDSR